MISSGSMRTIALTLDPILFTSNLIVNYQLFHLWSCQLAEHFYNTKNTHIHNQNWQNNHRSLLWFANFYFIHSREYLSRMNVKLFELINLRERERKKVPAQNWKSNQRNKSEQWKMHFQSKWWKLIQKPIFMQFNFWQKFFAHYESLLISRAINFIFWSLIGFFSLHFIFNEKVIRSAMLLFIAQFFVTVFYFWYKCKYMIHLSAFLIQLQLYFNEEIVSKKKIASV